MTIEATLTRRFEITFIDARALATEAKLGLDITCYPSKSQREALIEEASRIYEARSEGSKEACQSRRLSLESVKSSSGSSACSETSQEFSGEFPLSCSGSTRSAQRRRDGFYKRVSSEIMNMALARKKNSAL